MSRSIRFALTVPLALALAGNAHAADEKNWSFGIGSIYIGSATNTLNITVQNTAASTDPEDRELEMTSAPPNFNLHGQVFCKAILSGETRLVESQVLFGTALNVYTNPGSAIWETDVWDATNPIVFGGNGDSANVDFAHQVDMPTTWEGGLITLGFNPVKVVEDRLKKYVDNGGTAAEFLKWDDVFEVKVPVNLVGVCENTSDYGVAEYAGYTRRDITIAIFYKGDPDIQEDVVALDVPDTITQNPYIPPRLLKMLGTSIYTFDARDPIEFAYLLEWAARREARDTRDDGTTDPTTGDPTTGDPTTGGSATGDSATGDSATGDSTGDATAIR